MKAQSVQRPWCAVIIAFMLLFLSCNQEPTPTQLKAFIGATVIDGTGRPALEDAVLVVRSGRIETLGKRADVSIPKGAHIIDVSDRFLIPGLINCHGHVGDTRGLETGHYSQENILDQLKRYARYGITTVNSLGGDGEAAVPVRAAQASPDLNRSRLLIAGDVVAAEEPDVARDIVDKNAQLGVDFIKFRVDDFLGTRPKMPMSVCEAIIDRAHEKSLPVAAHLFYLDDAKALVNAGVDFVAHSVRDRQVDPELIRLLKERRVPYCPTLTREVSVFAYESEPDFFSDPFFLKEADPDVLNQLKDSARQEQIRDNPTTERYKQALEIAMKNLKTLADAGVTIAFGTDSGPPARFQGYFEHLELAMMAEAGLTPMQILQSATKDAAQTIGRNDLGTLAAGNWADFVVLSKNPLEDIKNTHAIESVWIAGNQVPAQDPS